MEWNPPHPHRYMQQAKAYSHPLFNVLTYAFALTFIAVRIGYGGWHTYNILIMTTTGACAYLRAHAYVFHTAGRLRRMCTKP